MSTFFFNKAMTFLKGEDGPAAVEYAVMLALILAAIFATVQAVGMQVGDAFTHAQSDISDAVNK